jgi:hypothetical protein
MSQSDYLKYKRVARELKTNKLDPVFTQRDYLSYKEYALENINTQNTKLTYNKLTPINTQIIMGIEKKIPVIPPCPTFIVCKDTNTRPNRVALLDTLSQPRPYRPINEKKIRDDVKNTAYCQECVNIYG